MFIMAAFIVLAAHVIIMIGIAMLIMQFSQLLQAAIAPQAAGTKMAELVTKEARSLSSGCGISESDRPTVDDGVRSRGHCDRLKGTSVLRVPNRCSAPQELRIAKQLKCL